MHSPSICKNNGHTLTRTPKDIRRKDERQIRSSHLRSDHHVFLQEHLEKTNDEKEDSPIHRRQLFADDPHDRFRVFGTADALVVQLVGDKRLL